MRAKPKRHKSIPSRYAMPLTRADMNRIAQNALSHKKRTGEDLTGDRTKKFQSAEYWLEVHYKYVDIWCETFGHKYYTPEELYEYRYWEREKPTTIVVEFIGVDELPEAKKLTHGELVLLGKKCTKYCTDRALPINKKKHAQNPQWRDINVYPKHVVEQLFTEYKQKNYRSECGFQL